MGLLDWVFKKHIPQPDSTRASSTDKVFEIRASFITIPSIDYYGLYRRAPGEKWLLSWKDSTPDGSRGGSREAGEGRYVLVDVKGNKVRVDARMARPNNGSVANNGTFCLEDWHFGNTLSGTFHVFSGQGAPIITKELSANIMLKRKPENDELQSILASLIRARSLGADENLAWKPTALKVQGLAHEALGQAQEAIVCYEEALRLNPKIGVKRRLDSLLKGQR